MSTEDDDLNNIDDEPTSNVVPINPDVELKEAIAAVAEKRKPGRPSGASQVRTPLEYMIWVMNNPKTDASRRDRMAIAAAKYLHRTQGGAGELGKKEQKQKQADELSSSGSKYAPAKPPRLAK